MFRLMSIVLVAGTVACAQSASPPAGSATSQAADTIYTGGDIVTVNDSQPSVEALAVKEGRIQALGTRGDVEKAHRRPRHADRRPGRQDARPQLHRRARPLHQRADGGQPGQSLRSARRTRHGSRRDRRRAGQVPRRAQDPAGRADSSLRLRRERHAEGQPAQPRSPGQGAAGESRDRRSCVHARSRAQLRSAETVRHLGADENARRAASSSESPEPRSHGA